MNFLTNGNGFVQLRQPSPREGRLQWSAERAKLRQLPARALLGGPHCCAVVSRASSPVGGWFAARAVVARSGVRAPSRGPALRVVTSRSSSPHPQRQVVLVKTMRYNHAVHTDAREAWFFFHRTPLAR